MSASIVWLIILAVMIIIEIATLGLTTIWFGIGAIGAAVVSGLGYGIWNMGTAGCLCRVICDCYGVVPAFCCQISE